MQDNALPPIHEGVEEWLDVVDHALRGLHHALNNRIGSLSALVELYQSDTKGDDAPALSSISTEVSRLEECSRIARLLPRSPAVGEEPLAFDDVLADCFAIHRFLHDARDIQVTIVPTRYIEPVRVERWALVHTLTLLLGDAKRLAQTTRSIVRALTESDEQWVQVEFQVGTPLVAGTPLPVKSAYADRLALTFGGTVTRKPGVAALRLPTLKARRAADRR